MARSSSARLRGRLAFLALLALTGSASAAVTLSSFPPNPGVLPGGGWQFTSGTTFANPPPPRAWVNGVYGGLPKIVATDTLVLSGRAGALTVGVSQSVGLADAAAAVGRCLLGGGPLCAVGTAAAAAYAAYRLNTPSGVPGGSTVAGADQFDYDPGTNKITGSCSGYTDFSGPSRVDCLSAKQWCDIRATNILQGYPGTKRGRLVGSGPSTTCYSESSTDGQNWNIVNGDLMGNPVTVNGAKTCPPSIDASNSAYSLPGGLPAGPDGKCATARYNHVPIAVGDVAGIITANPPSFPDPVWRDALRDAVASGESVPAEISANGPASQIGAPTSSTTTTPSGTTTTTTTPTYNYSYNGDKITYTTTTVTNTCTGAGACSTNNADKTTTTTTGSPAPQDPADPCTADPSRLGCLKLGDPPDNKIPKNNKTVTFTPEALGLGGSCPAPVQLPHGQQISYQTVCDGVVQARPLIIAMGFLMAGGIMLGALRPQ